MDSVLRELYSESPSHVPSFVRRVFAVWLRHLRVYVSHVGNYFPPVIEPLIVFLGCKYGFGLYVDAGAFEGSYMEFVIPAIAANIVMWTASFECTFESFVRMHYERIYEQMVSTPIGVRDLVLGEISFASTKGFLFSAIFIVEMYAFGEIDFGFGFLIPFFGFFAAALFASMGLYVTAHVRSMHTLNFYISGVIVPMAFLSGGFFPLDGLSFFGEYVVWMMPLKYVIDGMRGVFFGDFGFGVFLGCFVVVFLSVVCVFLAVRSLSKVIMR